MWRKTRLTWKGLLLEQTEVQQSAYCVRRSRREEEFNYRRAVFGHKIFTLLRVTLWYKITDLLHDLHQGFLRGAEAKVVMPK